MMLLYSVKRSLYISKFIKFLDLEKLSIKVSYLLEYKSVLYLVFMISSNLYSLCEV